MVRSSRTARYAILALAALLAWLSPRTPTSAQSLARLHVESFVLSSDTKQPHVEQPFHIEIVIHVKEQISNLQNVVLPPFIGLDILGDESTTHSSPGGTTYDERLTVVAHGGGTIEITPAYLDAVDARDGAPKRFLSNALTLSVAGPLQNPISTFPWGFIVSIIVRIFETLIAFACLGIIIFVLVKRRRPLKTAPLVLPVAVPTFVPVVDPKGKIRDALAALQREPIRPNALRARSALRAWLSIPDGATLSDALRYPQARLGNVRDALTAAERAAFVYEDGLASAIHDFIPKLLEILA